MNEIYYAIIAILAILFLQCLLAYVYTGKMLNKKPYSYHGGLEREIMKGNITEEFLQNFISTEFKIKSPNGYSIYGKYHLQAVATNKTAIIMHGHAGNYIWSYKYVKIFADLGYNWFVFDNRGCGNSGGKGYTMGLEESSDLVAVMNFARKVVPTAQIVLHGESLGASTAILALDRDLGDDVKCVIADCGFSDLSKEVKYQLNINYMPWHFVGIFGSLLTQIKYGFFFKNVSPLKVLQAGRFETPILFIHGKQDKKTPCWMAQEMFDAYNGKKEIYLCEKSAHARTYSTDKVKYAKLVEDFCEKWGGNATRCN
ncbi:MAG: alpha/beta hydrolase [Bacillota bacterium]